MSPDMQRSRRPSPTFASGAMKKVPPMRQPFMRLIWWARRSTRLPSKETATLGAGGKARKVFAAPRT